MGELPVQVLPPVVYIKGEDFAVQCAVHAVPQADHIVHVKGFSLP